MRLSHLSAAAVLVALVAALFVSLGSVRAVDPPLRPGIETAVGDVSHNTGRCIDGSPTAVPATDTDAYIMSFAADGTLGTSAPTFTDGALTDVGDAVWVVKTAENPATSATEFERAIIRCKQSQHQQNVKIIPNGQAAPIVEFQAPSISISIGDTDGIVADDGELTVSISLRNFDGALVTDTADRTPTFTALDYVRVSSELEDPTSTVEGAANNLSLATGGMSWAGEIVIPDGTTPREYTISTRVSFNHDGDADTDDRQVSASKSFTVGDAGTNVSGASLTLSNARDDNPRRNGDSSVRETGSDSAADGEVWLRLFSTNSLGSPSNPGDITSVTVIAAGADIAIHNATWDGDLGALVRSENPSTDADASDKNSASIETIAAGVGHTTFIKIMKAGSPPKPGSINVYAIVIGEDGSATSETLTLNFTGAGATLELGEAKSVSPGKQTEFTIKALDTGGNNAPITQLAFKVTDADGKRAEGMVDVSESTVGKSTPTPLDDTSAKAGLVTVKNTAKAGVYTIEVSLPSVAGSAVTTTVVVAGAANDVALAADPETGDAAEQDVIKITATVTDKNGANVADGTLVEFTVLGGSLSAIGPGHAPITTETSKQLVNVAEPDETPKYEERTLTNTSGGVKTKDGKASVNYVVTGAGTAVVSATTQGGGASGVLRVTTTDSAAEAEAPAMTEPEEAELSLACLSEQSGFTTLICDLEASASEIFALVSGRGATAIHLWNGSAWVRYSVVDGETVPGSSDFMATRGDVLYISN